MVTVTLSDPAFAAFRDAALTAYPDMPLSAALREAALAWMGTDPLEAAKIAARRAAFLEARAQFYDTMGAAMRQAFQNLATLEAA